MKTNSIFYLVSIVLVLGSCAPAYVPNVINSPMLSEKMDLNIAGYTGTAGYDLQGAFAITDNIGIMVNGSFADRTSDSTNSYHKHVFLEAGPGYFTKVGNSGIVEIYGGFGIGNVDSYYESSVFTNYANATISRIYLQPGVGFISDFFDGSFTSRFALVNINQDQISETGLFVEPALTGKLGYKWVKFTGQLGFSVPLNPDDIHFEYQPIMISIGLQINLGSLLKQE